MTMILSGDSRAAGNRIRPPMAKSLPGFVTVQVETTDPGLLVIGTTWMPGWQARVDGRDVQILKGNHCQQVVPLESGGRHEVELRFTPPGLYAGLVMTGSAFDASGVCSRLRWWPALAGRAARSREQVLARKRARSKATVAIS